jgi:hypothetical protein
VYNIKWTSLHIYMPMMPSFHTSNPYYYEDAAADDDEAYKKRFQCLVVAHLEELTDPTTPPFLQFVCISYIILLFLSLFYSTVCAK